ncbi:hypothetical protein J4H86_26380 [Spiractinospora alimapuensis]|uniref:hypothetical protein n=1 Tax=Spiractinospora alimapuensis TaxID=2820884 RepID=UPI001F2A061D|nr:hypothetical protein [Spiractinospora alimapuensis]QVQ52183.1 hypothetical protein J4H86_26380 [Spiractinospora alimapuensis]
MTMTLGDAFNRRKKLASDLASWTNRLALAGREQRSFRTQALEGPDAYVPEPGTHKQTHREYTVEECRERIAAILAEDEDLALRISRTNQRARAEIEDLEGRVRTLSIPELLVLKDDIIPKLEAAARAVPTRADDVGIVETGDGWRSYRTVRKVERKNESFSEKGLKVEEIELLGYDVVEVTDYGVPRRDQWDETDRIGEFAQRVKQAINKANQTELATLD